MSEPIEIFGWKAFYFGNDEYRLTGYRDDGDFVKWLITEPMRNIWPANGVVETWDGKSYRPTELLQTSQQMDTLYNLGKWTEVSTKPQPSDVSEMILEELTKKVEPIGGGPYAIDVTEAKEVIAADPPKRKRGRPPVKKKEITDGS